MLSRFLRQSLRLALLTLAGTAFSACVTVSETREEDPVLSQSALRPIGRVIWVDSAEGTAVIQLHRGASLTSETLISRNDALFETGRLQPAGPREGRSAGARILEGLPNAGDEVVAAP
jgi:hypothetical protein